MAEKHLGGPDDDHYSALGVQHVKMVQQRSDDDIAYLSRERTEDGTP